MTITPYIYLTRAREKKQRKTVPSSISLTSFFNKKKELRIITQFLLHMFILPNGNYRHMQSYKV